MVSTSKEESNISMQIEFMELRLVGVISSPSVLRLYEGVSKPAIISCIDMYYYICLGNLYHGFQETKSRSMAFYLHDADDIKSYTNANANTIIHNIVVKFVDLQGRASASTCRHSS